MILTGTVLLPERVIEFGSERQFAKEVAERGFVEHFIYRWLSRRRSFSAVHWHRTLPDTFPSGTHLRLRAVQVGAVQVSKPTGFKITLVIKNLYAYCWFRYALTCTAPNAVRCKCRNQLSGLLNQRLIYLFNLPIKTRADGSLTDLRPLCAGRA